VHPAVDFRRRCLSPQLSRILSHHYMARLRGQTAAGSLNCSGKLVVALCCQVLAQKALSGSSAGSSWILLRRIQSEI